MRAVKQTGWSRRERWLAAVACPIFGHPPITSMAWRGHAEAMMRRLAETKAEKGETLTVNCLCGRRQVSPIWDPWFYRDGVVPLKVQLTTYFLLFIPAAVVVNLLDEKPVLSAIGEPVGLFAIAVVAIVALRRLGFGK